MHRPFMLFTRLVHFMANWLNSCHEDQSLQLSWKKKMRSRNSVHLSEQQILLMLLTVLSVKNMQPQLAKMLFMVQTATRTLPSKAHFIFREGSNSRPEIFIKKD